jgi:hypothetical protein
MFTCPITLQEMTCPVVLPCGHTFDRKSILKLEKTVCPLCKRRFYKDQYSPNWILIQHLCIDVNTQNKTPEWTAEDARNEMSKIDIDDRIVNRLLRKIKQRAIFGDSTLTCTYYTLTQRMVNSFEYR